MLIYEGDYLNLSLEKCKFIDTYEEFNTTGTNSELELQKQLVYNPGVKLIINIQCNGKIRRIENIFEVGQTGDGENCSKYFTLVNKNEIGVLFSIIRSLGYSLPNDIDKNIQQNIEKIYSYLD